MRKITLLIISFILFQTVKSQTYNADPTSYNTNGGGTWGAILKIRCIPTSNGTATFYVRKTDGTTFSSAGTMYLKVGGYNSYNTTRTQVNVSAGVYVVSINTDFTPYSNYPKEFYARYEPSSVSGYAWTGPITVYGPPTVSLNSISSNYQVGQTMHITWSSTNQHHYGLYLMQGNSQIADINTTAVSSSQSYNWTIPSSINGHTLNGSNYKLKLVIWNTGISGNEQHVFEISPTFGITPQQTNHPPNDPVIYSYANNIYVNQQFTLRVRSGSDPDGDNTKVQVASPNSNHPDSNPYVSGWNYSATTYDIPFTFTQTGQQIVYAVTYDENGSASAVVQKTFNVLPQQSNNPPNSPAFLPLPSGSTITENQPTHIPIRSGSDPDNDPTKIEVYYPSTSGTPVYTSSFNTGSTNYSVPITFTSSGNQTVYCKTVDNHGNSSSMVSRTYNVQQASSGVPAQAQFLSPPLTTTINTPTTFNIAAGSDPDNDQVRVKLWGTASNYSTESNALYSNFGNSGSNFSLDLTFSSTGTQTVYVKTIDDNGNESGVNSINITVNNNSTITSVNIGNITFTADAISQTSNNVYSLTGNVKANNILKFTGTLTVDKNNFSISGNGKVYLTNIPNISNGEVDLYNGSFSYSVDGAISKLQSQIINQANELFKMAELPIHVDDIKILNDGVEINGQLKLPEAFGHINAEISQIRITQSQGIDMNGSIGLNEIRLTNSDDYKISGNLTFNTSENSFEGTVNLHTPQFGIDAGLTLKNGRVDSISIGYYSMPGIILGTTGLVMTGVHGSLEHIQPPHPPNTEVTLGMSLAPIGGGSIIQLRDVSLTYVFDESFEGNGSFDVLGESLANAHFTVKENYFEIGADANFYDIVSGRAIIDIAKERNNPNETLIYGNFQANAQIPDRNDLLFRLLKGLGMNLPYMLVDANNHLTGSTQDNYLGLSGGVTVNHPAFQGFPFKFSYSINSRNNYIPDFYTNWRDLQAYLNSTQTHQLVFQTPPAEYLNRNSRTYNRFDGRSLIVNPREYNINRQPNQNIQIDFLLPSVTEKILVTVKPQSGSGNVPSYQLISPSGQTIDVNNVNSLPDVIHAEYNQTKESYFAIHNAEAGAWHILIPDDGRTYLVDLDGVEERAGIGITNIQQNNNQVTVEWLDFCDNYNGQISIYYDNDNQGFDGTLLATNISEDADGSNGTFTFNTDDIPPGQYYIYATIYDENGNPASSYSQNFFTIGTQIPAPTNLNYNLNGNNVELTWTKLNNGNTYDYLVYYQENGNVNYDSPHINAGDTDHTVLTNLDNTKNYQITVVAQDPNNLLGAMSNTVDVEFSKIQTFDLNAGWNLISLNIVPPSTDVADFTSSIASNLLEIRNATESYDPNIDNMFNTLHQINNSEGYWIKMLQPTTFQVSGSTLDVQNLQIHLNQGWNLVAYPLDEIKDVPVALSSITPYLIEVRNATQSYDPNLPDNFNTLHQMKPNEGYWIKVSQNCILTY